MIVLKSIMVLHQKNGIKGGKKMNEGICVSCGKPAMANSMVCHDCSDMEPSFDVIKIKVRLSKIKDVTEFVNLATQCTDDVVVKSERFAVSAKSIMGLYSLDLSKPLNVEFYGNIPYEVKEGIKKFIVD